MTEQNPSTTAVVSGGKGARGSVAVAGPLTARDVAVLGAVVAILVASLLPIVFRFAVTGNMWNYLPLYFLGIGVLLPLVVGALFVLRRVIPGAKPRIGSLSVDQFGSVVACFATGFFFLATVTSFHASYLVGLAGSLLLLSGTVLAPWIPFFAADFTDRTEFPAHPVARDAFPAARKPAAPRPVLSLPAAGGRPGPGRPGYVQADAGQPDAAQPGYAQPGTGHAAGAPAAGPVQSGWNAGQPAGAGLHVPAGQIFTPAPDNPTPDGGAGPAPTTHDSAVPETAMHQAAVPGGQSAAPLAGANPAADPARVPPAETTPGPAEPGTGVSDGVAPATGASHTPAGPEPTPAQSAPATMINPQIAEPRESIGATVDPAARTAAPVAYDPFWFAVDRPQNVLDEHTLQFAFKLTPGSWILALEDRGSSFLVQDSHGKTGVLLDLVGIERAPEGQ
ncbi:hypothetical protein [Specibacter sp. RAF43]|uniref:hypothetical protein n=1 Tax=Specibacter sp. RAF43 TaxID=3233057 RepID=UPI003F97076F